MSEIKSAISFRALGRLMIFIVLIQAIGFFGAFFKPDSWFAALIKPQFQPPNWVFAPVWIILYVMLAVSIWLLFEAKPVVVSLKKQRTKVLFLSVLHLCLNGLWSPVFFGLHSIVGGMIILSVLIPVVIVCIMIGLNIDRRASWLLLPYITWLFFAWTLNIWLLQLN